MNNIYNYFFTHFTSTNLYSILNSTLFLHMVSSLSQIILLIIILSWLIKKVFTLKYKNKNSNMKITDKIYINTHQSIIILDICKVKLVLGITDKKISYLYTLSPNIKDKKVEKK